MGGGSLSIGEASCFLIQHPIGETRVSERGEEMIKGERAQG
jgi:hypothetical protein